MTRVLIFDGHNDALSRLWGAGGDPVAGFRADTGHVNAPAARAGGLAGGFLAMFSPPRRGVFDFARFDVNAFAGPLPPPMDEGAALVPIIGQAGIACQLRDAGLLEIITDGAGLARAFVGDTLACVLHLEGADCIGTDLLALDALHAVGLRSLGPVWSRPTVFGEGVPFGRDRDGDTGPGLTEDGKRLIRRCADLGIVVDTSHLTMKGFWDVGAAGLPLVATHSNAFAVCPTTRNLTDDQLRAIGQTGGIAGLNFATIFLDLCAWDGGKVGLDACIRHLAHMVDVAGEDAVALGSDFDGAPLPDGIGSAADLPNLVRAMETADFGDALIAGICHENWLSFLGRHFGAGSDRNPTHVR